MCGRIGVGASLAPQICECRVLVETDAKLTEAILVPPVVSNLGFFQFEHTQGTRLHRQKRSKLIHTSLVDIIALEHKGVKTIRRCGDDHDDLFRSKLGALEIQLD
eukprot:scaffold7407_cov131-Isochrysis_galbana.AAC.3